MAGRVADVSAKAEGAPVGVEAGAAFAAYLAEAASGCAPAGESRFAEARDLVLGHRGSGYSRMRRASGQSAGLPPLLSDAALSRAQMEPSCLTNGAAPA